MYTQKEEVKWICPNCGSHHRTSVYSQVSVKELPDIQKHILDASIFKMECETCGTEEYYLGPLLYVDEDQKYMISMGVNPDFEKERDDYLSLGYVVRQVPEIVDLCEKILIREHHLDDRIVELMKAANRVLLKEQKFDQMLYAPDGTDAYFELIKDASSIGRIPFLAAIYEDMKERFGTALENQYDIETVINFSWAANFFDQYYHASI